MQLYLKYARKYAFIFLIISTLILIYKYNFKPQLLFFLKSQS